MKHAYISRVVRQYVPIVSVAVLLVGAVVPSLASAEDVVIGAYIPTTGPFAPLGVDMRNGYELAVKDVAKVKGMPVRLVVEDSQANASVGLTKAQKMVLSDRAKVLIGGASSAVVLAINAQADRLNVPIVTTNGQAIQVTGDQCSKYLFRTNPNDAMTARANRLLMKQRPDLLQKKWFIVFHDYVWGRSNKDEFKAIPGLKVAGEAGRPLGTADWSSLMSQIQASDADAIYLALAVGNDMPAFIRQARDFGLKQMMLPPLGMPDSMLQAIGKDAVGLTTGGLFGTWMSEDANAEMSRFVQAYYRAYQMVPGPQAIQAYAGMRFTLAALESAKTLATPDILKALETTSIQTVIGPLSIRKEDHQGKVPLFNATVTQLPNAKYGAQVGWKVVKEVPWDDVKVDLKETGCKGL